MVGGEFIGRLAPGMAVAPISVEKGLADDLQLKLGDEVDWDVQGLVIRTRVASLRAVEWRRLEPNFFVVFPEGVLEAAPKFYVAAVRAAGPTGSANLQRAVVKAFPNVTAIDLALVLATLDGIFSKVTFVIDFMALFTVVTGMIVLVGAVFNGRHQRRRETVLLRTLGATRRQLARIQLVEYAVLGALAALVGSSAGARVGRPVGARGLPDRSRGAALGRGGRHRLGFHSDVDDRLAGGPEPASAISAGSLAGGDRLGSHPPTL